MKHCPYPNHIGKRKIANKQFGSNIGQPDGLHYYCKDCVNAYTREHRKARTPDQILRTQQNHKRYYSTQKVEYKARYTKYRDELYTTGKGLELRLLQAARRRAKEKGIEFNLLPTDLFIPDKCSVLGIQMRPNRGGKPMDNSPSIDRINSNKGYTKDNCIVISFKANTIKNRGTPEEHLQIYKFYSELLK